MGCGLERIEPWLNYYQCRKCKHLFLEAWKAGMLFLLDELEKENAYMTGLSEAEWGKKTQAEIAGALKCPRCEEGIEPAEIGPGCPVCGGKFEKTEMEVFFEKKPRKSCNHGYIRARG